jgi:hypothetical protein
MSGKTPASKKGTRRPRPLRWSDLVGACRSPETRSQLKELAASASTLVDACVSMEDRLEFVKTKAAKEERDRLRVIRRRGEETLR